MTTARAVRGWYLFVGIAAVTIVAAFWLDEPVRHWFTENRSRDVRAVMQIISQLGDWPAHVVLGLLLLGLAYVRWNKRWMAIFVAMLLACALSGGLARIIKIGAGRARPSVQSEQRWSGPQLSSKYHAFPSGHTAASAAFFGVLAFARPRIGAPALLVPALIAFARMYVAAHYLSDVVCAFLLGIACAWFVWRWISRRPETAATPA